MRRSLLIALLALLAGCTSPEQQARPAITARILQPSQPAAACIAAGLGREFQDPSPQFEMFRDTAEISVRAPRGGLIAFVTVAPDPLGGTMVKFYNGELYWPRIEFSGIFPDIGRDNWHRAERAIRACATESAAIPTSL
jgi:hypothetical protein